MKQQSRYAPCPRPPLLRSPVVASIVLFASTTAAQNDAPAPAPKPPPSVSITFSPLHLLLPVVELSGEYRVGKLFGVALILGSGSISTTLGTERERFRAREFGGRFNVYPWGISRGAFEGPQFGVEAVYLELGTTENVKVTGAAQGLAIGLPAGYKLIAFGWLTVELTGGLQIATRIPRVLPLLNLNVGCSF